MECFRKKSVSKRVPRKPEEASHVSKVFPWTRLFQSCVSRKVDFRGQQKGGDSLKKIVVAPVTSK